MVELLTGRLRIRENLPSDLESWHRLFGDAQNMCFVQGLQTHSFEESHADMQAAIDAARESPRVKHFFAVELALTGAYAGNIGFTRESKNGEIMGGIGWFFLPEYQGKGYATEAFQALIPRMFRDWGVTIIDAGCNAANRASERVMQKGGMTLVQQYDNRLRYQLTKEDWENSQQA